MLFRSLTHPLYGSVKPNETIYRSIVVDSKEEVEAIKIELDYMNTQLANGQGDALLERQKEKALERLDKLEYQIHEHEKRVLDTRY